MVAPENEGTEDDMVEGAADEWPQIDDSSGAGKEST